MAHHPRAFAAAWALCFALAQPIAARAQSATGEVDVTVGTSTDERSIGSMQARLLAATKSDWRLYLETSWAGLSSGYATDAFGSAYPYDGRVHPMEMYGERMFRRGATMAGFRAGRYRTPFGIAGRSEHAYSGFLRAPLIRYGTNFALSNTFLESGAEVVAGIPSLFVETSLGVPQDAGSAQRRNGLDTVVRVQGYVRDAILGVSYLHTQPSDRRSFVRGSMTFRGIDGRWMRSGIEFRGEWVDGRPFAGVSTRGGYLDAIVHPRVFGPVTAVARVERLDYDAGQFSKYIKRFTSGARVRIAPSVTVQANVMHEPGRAAPGREYAFDVAFTFSRRF